MILFILNRTYPLLQAYLLAHFMPIALDIIIVSVLGMQKLVAACNEYSALALSGLISVAETASDTFVVVHQMYSCCALLTAIPQIIYFAQTPGEHLSCFTSKI